MEAEIRSGYVGALDSDEIWGEAAGNESLKDQIKGFVTAWGELAAELGRGCWELVQQTILAEDSYFMSKARKPLSEVSEKVRFLNDFFPEDRDPGHVSLVVFAVCLLTFAALNVISKTKISEMKEAALQSPSAAGFLLPDGRFMAYHELGVEPRNARFTLIVPHAFLRSGSSGVFGIKPSLLEAFGVRLIAYDLPGFGKSSFHRHLNLNSSAHDMLFLAGLLGVKEKFWVLGYSSAAPHAWAALKYIPDRVAGAAMFAPVINPNDEGMTKEEKSRVWKRWPWRRRIAIHISRTFPSLGRFLQLAKSPSSSLSKKDKVLIEASSSEEIWKWDDESALHQFADWGFSLVDLQPRRRCLRRDLIPFLQFLYARPDCELTGFLGPIHLWQGMDDTVVAPAVSDYVERVLPGASVYRLPGEGHFSYLFFCEECHRWILTTMFGSPMGPAQTEDKSQLAPFS